MVNSKANSGSGALTDSKQFSRDIPLLEIKGVSKKFGDFDANLRQAVNRQPGYRLWTRRASGCRLDSYFLL